MYKKIEVLPGNNTDIKKDLFLSGKLTKKIVMNAKLFYSKLSCLCMKYRLINRKYSEYITLANVCI